MGYSSLERERRRKGSIESHTLAMRVEEVSNLRVELALDSIGRQFEDKDRMPDCIESSRYVQRNDPDLMFDMKGLHPLLGEYKQHIQGRLARSESELMI